MAMNRITQFATPDNQPASNPPAPPAVPQGFVVCPPQMAAMQAWQQEIYRLAYERASRRADPAPSPLSVRGVELASHRLLCSAAPLRRPRTRSGF